MSTVEVLVPEGATCYLLKLDELSVEGAVFVGPNNMQLRIDRAAWTAAGSPVSLEVPIVGQLVRVPKSPDLPTTEGERS